MIGFAVYTGEIEGSMVLAIPGFHFGPAYDLCIAAWLINWVIAGLTVATVVAERSNSGPTYAP